MVWLKNIKDYLEEKKYLELLDNFEKNKNYAIIWKTVMGLYPDWKLGVLTEEKIDEELEKCRSIKGALLAEPFNRNQEPTNWLDFDQANLITFAEDLKSELKDPKLKKRLEKNNGIFDEVDGGLNQ